MDIPESIAKPFLNDAYVYHVGYVKDPDGNWIELYDDFKPIGLTVPEGYH